MFQLGKSMRSLGSGAARLTALVSGGFVLGALALPAVGAPLALHCSGNVLKDSNNNTFILRGGNIPGCEYSYTGDHISTSPGVLLGTWKGNVIRLPMSEDFWFGWNGTTQQSDQGASYQAMIDGVVTTASNAGAYVILDCHWGDAGQAWGSNQGQHPGPDSHTTTFWSAVATHYKNNPAVLFDLWNEPHDTTWSVWQNGGTISGSPSYTSPGHQALVTAIRNTGATNIIMAEGENWGTDFTSQSGFPGLTDSTGNIMYSTHIYPSRGSTNSQWDAWLSAISASHPILVGEWGDDPNACSSTGAPSPDAPTWTQNFISWLNLHSYNYTAWSFNASTCPIMISDWNYTPSTYFGQYVKNDLVAHAGGGTTIPSAPTGLTATAGNAQVSLSWGASSGATSYNVKRSTVSGSGYATVSSPTTTSYTNTGLTNGTAYYYVVTAVNSAGESGNSGQASATPTAGGTSGLVKINAAGPAVSPFVADVDFSGGTTATNWTGTIDTSAVSSPAPQAVYQSERYGSPAMSYTIGGLTAGTTYTVRLHFCENYFTASGLRKFSVAINGTTVLTSFDIFATTGAIHKANVQQFNVAANGSGQEVITFTNVVNNALINGIEVNASGGSAPPTPTGLVATAGNAQVSLAWNASTGATSYNVKGSGTSGGPFSTWFTVGTNSGVSTALTNGTTYYFVVSAVNASGESANSSQVSGTPGAGTSVKLNAGGPAVSPFVADADFSGGTTATNWTGTIDTSAVTSPAPQAVYQSERYGSPAMSYTIAGFPSGSSHTVRLHFCENYFTTSAQRKFNVAINGTTVLTNFDIWATAGATHKANIQQFTATANGSGQYVIAFTNVTNNALINGIEVN